MDAIALVLIMMELDQVEAWRSKPRAWETYSLGGGGRSGESMEGNQEWVSSQKPREKGLQKVGRVDLHQVSDPVLE